MEDKAWAITFRYLMLLDKEVKILFDRNQLVVAMHDGTSNDRVGLVLRGATFIKVGKPHDSFIPKSVRRRRRQTPHRDCLDLHTGSVPKCPGNTETDRNAAIIAWSTETGRRSEAR